MPRIVRSLSIAGLLALAVGSSTAAVGDVQVGVGVNIGIPPPPPVIVNPPPFVVVPSTPAVQYAPGFSINVFLHGGRYYAWHDGAWFVTANFGQPWVFVEPAYVPRPVLVVPSRYYRLAPGQLKKLYHSSPVPHYGHPVVHGHPGHGGGHGKHHKHKGRH